VRVLAEHYSPLVGRRMDGLTEVTTAVGATEALCVLFHSMLLLLLLLLPCTLPPAYRVCLCVPVCLSLSLTVPSRTNTQTPPTLLCLCLLSPAVRTRPITTMQ